VDSGGDVSVDTVKTQQTLHAAAVLQPLNPSVCFVQDSESTMTSAQFKAATDVMKEVISHWDEVSGLTINWLGTCPPPTEITEGQEKLDVYSGNIRIFYNEFGRTEETKIPGRGCESNNSNGNWGAYPTEEGTVEHCKWNASLAINQPINNYLHEFGHTLGFIHEHERSDNNVCGGAVTNGSANGRLLTRYDINSVMGYFDPSCGALGNWGWDGLSDRDRLGAEIAYPASSTIKITAEGFDGEGKAIVRDDTALQPEWIVRGATPAAVMSPVWSINGVVLTRNVSVLSGTLPQGEPFDLVLKYYDPWERSKQGTLEVEVSNEKHAAIALSVL
jgi:hypothetical protein